MPNSRPERARIARQWLYALLWLAVPVHLLWMQQPVYSSNKALTVLRYLAIGSAYLYLVGFVVMHVVLAGISAWMSRTNLNYISGRHSMALP